MSYKTEVLVIGAGPGGYPAAIRAAQLGKSVIIIDKGSIGGECLNWGCIPSKALVSASSLFHKIKHDASTMGIEVSEPSINMEKLQAWKQSITNRLVDGIKQLFKANKIQLLLGTAKFLDQHRVQLTTPTGETEEIEADYIILATGSSFITLPNLPVDEERILTAKGLLSLKQIPKHLIIIGGGVIGMELGTVFAKLGSKITVVELLPQILPGTDKQLVRMLKKRLDELGFTIYTESKAQSVQFLENGNLLLTVQTKSGELEIEADHILVSIGKRASTKELNLEAIGVETDERGFIIVNEQQRTNIPHVFAVGDCTGMPFLAHRATKQGIIAAEVIGGLDSKFDYTFIPGAIFTDPEIATVGMSEKEAKEQGYKTMSSRAAFAVSGRALAQLEENGYVKIISNAETDELLGIEIIGPHASDLISEASLAIQLGLKAQDIAHTIHPHPTLPEMLMEAAESLLGKAIHVPNKRRR